MPTAHHPRMRRTATVGSSPTFEARLLYPTGHGQRSLVVECHPAGRGVVIRLPEFNDAGHYLEDAPVTVTAVSSGVSAVTPVIVGQSQALSDRDVDPDSVSALEQWPQGIRSRYFAITPTGPGCTGPA